jgi:DNA-binding MarR family transcriptional regulator
MAIDRLQTTLERICNLIRVEARQRGAESGLLPVQLEVLQYLAQCNRFSDTLQGVTEFLGQTKGTVSQTLKILEKRGLITKQTDEQDRRMVHHWLTGEGIKVLSASTPAKFLIRALEDAAPGRLEQLTEDLMVLLQTAQRVRGVKSFGACKTCRYLEGAGTEQRCGLTGEPLSQADTELICREHCYAQHNSWRQPAESPP